MAIEQDKQLNISALDFGDIKNNLKEFMKSQDEFTDHDFDASGMSVLLDVMAYTTHYMGYYSNMALNESFLDTASLRNSVVSHAKTLGYIPKSITSSEAIIKLSFDISGYDPTFIPVEKGTTFTTIVNGSSQQFTTLETINIFPDEIGDFSGEVKVNQGVIKTIQWIFDAGDENQKFLIQDSGCDRSTLKLSVNAIPWINNQRLSELLPDSLTYFIQEGLDSVTEIYFGNNIFGKIPRDALPVDVEYLSTEGEVANYTSTIHDQTFSLDTTINGIYDSNRVSIETINISSMGSPMEATESIRTTSPKSYERQNRAVTAEDYKTILLEKYPNIDSISVWGGEDNDPPQYGAVFISIKPKHGLELSPLTKEKLTKEVLSKYNILAVNPIIVAPEYTYIDIDTTIKYDPLLTSASTGEIQTIVMNNVQQFFDDEIGQFKVNLRFSKLTQTIDASDKSISNNLTSLKIYKKFYTQSSNTVGNYIFKFNNKINPGSAVSSVFGNTVDGSQMALLDDGQGNMLLYDIISEGFINTTQGTIDYDSGIIELNGFNPVLDINTVISLYATPKTNDIYTLRNNLLVLNATNVTLEVVTQ
jgi:hypothetical protein